jgi:hypothetical protein
MGLLFANLSATFLTGDIGRFVARRRVKPAEQMIMLEQPWRLLGQRDEDLLRDILREMGVTPDASQCRGVNTVEMTSDEFTESSLGARLRVRAQQGGIWGIRQHGSRYGHRHCPNRTSISTDRSNQNRPRSVHADLLPKNLTPLLQPQTKHLNSVSIVKRTCPSCGKSLLSGFSPLCNYCGAKLPSEALFDQEQKAAIVTEELRAKLTLAEAEATNARQTAARRTALSVPGGAVTKAIVIGAAAATDLLRGKSR